VTELAEKKNSMRCVRASAAARVDLAGGSLDLWPIGHIIPGSSTINLAVSLATAVQCRATDEPGVALASSDLGVAYRWRRGQQPGPLALAERLCAFFGVESGWSIAMRSDVPPGSGLGGSSAMSLALALALRAISGKEMADAVLVGLCRDVEAAHLGIPTGVQDFWPAVRGGVLCIRYEPGGERVTPLPVPLKPLAERLVVAYSGQSRLSAGTNWSLYKRFLDGEKTALHGLEGIAGVARDMEKALVEGDLDLAGSLLDLEWGHRCSLAEGISTPATEVLVAAAKRAGALGGKACGAGGGGCLAFLVREGTRLGVETALEREGASVLPAHPVAAGHHLEVD
jgi:D-glycero-alpha-D-manno-heptose-7-phosphate kinase